MQSETAVKSVEKRPKTWKVVKWEKRPEGSADGEPIELMCDCGREAECPTAGGFGVVLIARIGKRGLVTEPRIPGGGMGGWIPEEIQCRHCLRIFKE